jgi:uncharacterized membrane protein YdjX (TVP38/TMEM64 family)
MHRPRHLPAWGMVLALVVLALVLARPLHAWVLGLFEVASPLIEGHPVLGPLVFVLLCALSAMLAFFSSAIFVPLAVSVWGEWVTLALLWLGWWIGGLGAYLLGRYLGDPLVRRLAGNAVVDRYEGWLRQRVDLGRVILLHMAVPSEAASYLLGMVRVRWSLFLAAVAVAQLPFAVVAVLFGGSFLERRIAPLILFGVASMVISAVALRVLHDPKESLPTGSA